MPNSLPFFSDWQDRVRAQKTDTYPNMQLALMLDGVETVFNQYPHTPQTGYEGILMKCWTFWQFYSGALGEFTPQDTVFSMGWRDVYAAHEVAGWIGAHELAARLQATKETLESMDEELLDRFDAAYGRTTHHRTAGLEPLTDTSQIIDVAKVVFEPYGQASMTGMPAAGPDVSDATPERHYDKAPEPIQAALIRFLDALAVSDPKIVAAFGDPKTTPAPKIDQGPEASHHPKAIEIVSVWGAPELLRSCAKLGLWLDGTADISLAQAIPAQERPVTPVFLKTKAGQSLCQLGFLDGALILDTESWTELTRTIYTSDSGKRGPDGHARIADKPQVHFDQQTKAMSVKTFFKRPAKPLIYRD